MMSSDRKREIARGVVAALAAARRGMRELGLDCAAADLALRHAHDADAEFREAVERSNIVKAGELP